MENADASLNPQTQTKDDSTIPQNEKTLALIVYALLGLGLFTGITFIAAVIVNYVKRGDITSPVIQSHFSYQIRTFWWALGLGVLSWFLTFIAVGLVLALVVVIWYIYRVIKGLIRLNDGKAI